MYSFSNLETVYCSMSNSNCCFLTCIQISQEVGQVVWYSHLLKNFPQFAVIHTVKSFGIVKKAEVDVFQELSCSFNDPMYVGNLIYVTKYLWVILWPRLWALESAIPGFKSHLFYSAGDLICISDLTSPSVGFLIYKMEIKKRKSSQLMHSLKDLNKAINNQMPYLT